MLPGDVSSNRRGGERIAAKGGREAERQAPSFSSVNTRKVSPGGFAGRRVSRPKQASELRGLGSATAFLHRFALEDPLAAPEPD
jgi:hypothetical protein